MSRNFRTGEFVSHGSAASLDDLVSVTGGMTAWAWVFRGVDAANQHVISKDSGAGTGWLMVVNNNPSNGIIQSRAWRATVSTSVISSTIASALHTPAFVACTLNAAATPVGKLFWGDQSTAVAEVSYNTQTDGSGAFTSDASSNLYVGNLERATTTCFQGSVQMGGVIGGSTLSAANLETIRGLTLNAINTDDDLSDVQAAFAHVLLFNYQAGSVADRSGTGNNGSVTGAQSGPNFPFATSSGGGLLTHPGMGGGMRGYRTVPRSLKKRFHERLQLARRTGRKDRAA